MTMKRVLYLYPEEWTGSRARELHTLQTCLTMATAGIEVTLVTAGGFLPEKALPAVGHAKSPSAFYYHNLSRKIWPVKSAKIFEQHFKLWIKKQPRFDLAYIIHLKAAPILQAADIPYIWEAHEIFSETPSPGSNQAQKTEKAERTALQHARAVVATSHALAEALTNYFFNQGATPQIHVVPHGGGNPLPNSVADAAGPLVYAGSLQDWKGLELILAAAQKLDLPLRIIGGTKKEIAKAVLELQGVKQVRLSPTRRIHVVRNVEWREQIAWEHLPNELLGCKAGLNPTLPHMPSGHYSLPMKLFEYARCGLPAISTPLPSLADLGVERWCRFVGAATVEAWSLALMKPLEASEPVAALEWAGKHTWQHRGETLAKIILAL